MLHACTARLFLLDRQNRTEGAPSLCYTAARASWLAASCLTAAHRNYEVYGISIFAIEIAQRAEGIHKFSIKVKPLHGVKMAVAWISVPEAVGIGDLQRDSKMQPASQALPPLPALSKKAPSKPHDPQSIPGFIAPLLCC